MPARRMFGLKDVFTSLNVLGGCAALLICVLHDRFPRPQDAPFWAGVAILLGWIADALDGQVARWTSTGNKFGGEYDTIADHLAHVIAPAVIVFTAYRNKGPELGLSPTSALIVAAVLAGAIMIAGSVRHARNLVRPVSYKGIWCGLPRTAIGFLAISYANSLLLPMLPGGAWIGAAICILSCIFTLTYLPFASHHLARRLSWPARIAVILCMLTTFGILLVPAGRPFVFDIFLFWMVGYCLASWAALTREERHEWARLVVAAKARTDI
jgi:phosphatidylserine synthase